VEAARNYHPQSKEEAEVRDYLSKRINDFDTHVGCSEHVQHQGLDQKIQSLKHQLTEGPMTCTVSKQFEIECCNGPHCVTINPFDGAEPLSSCCAVENNGLEAHVVCSQDICLQPGATKTQCSTALQAQPACSSLFPELAEIVQKMPVNSSLIVDKIKTPQLHSMITHLKQRLGIAEQTPVYLGQWKDVPHGSYAINLNSKELEGQGDHIIEQVIARQLAQQMPIEGFVDASKCEKPTENRDSVLCTTRNGGAYFSNPMVERDLKIAVGTQNPCLTSRMLIDNPSTTTVFEKSSIQSWGSWLKHKLWENPFYSPWQKTEIQMSAPSQGDAPAVNTFTVPTETRQAILKGLDQKLQAAKKYFDGTGQKK
jgi:hypothetical protein